MNHNKPTFRNKHGHLGVSQIYSEEKNYCIILLHHDKHGKEITKSRVNFLILCWKGLWREKARTLRDKYYEFLGLSESDQKLAIEFAKEKIKESFVTLEVTMP